MNDDERNDARKRWRESTNRCTNQDMQHTLDNVLYLCNNKKFDQGQRISFPSLHHYFSVPLFSLAPPRRQNRWHPNSSFSNPPHWSKRFFQNYPCSLHLLGPNCEWRKHHGGRHGDESPSLPSWCIIFSLSCSTRTALVTATMTVIFDEPIPPSFSVGLLFPTMRCGLDKEAIPFSFKWRLWHEQNDCLFNTNSNYCSVNHCHVQE